MTAHPRPAPTPRVAALVCTIPLLLTLGCAASSLDDLPPELRTASVVSARGPGPALAPTGSFGWLPGSRIIVEPGTYDSRRVERMIQDELVQQMGAHGWTFAGGGAPDVQLGYVISAGNELDAAALRETFGMDPGLPTAGTAYEKGTLVLEVRRPAAPQALWRGSIQILADPSLSDELRRERIRNGIASLLRTVPFSG